MLKKALLLSVASAGALTVSSVASRPAQAQRFVSGSATVTNFTGSISSVGAEVGGVAANGVRVTPTYTSEFINGLAVGNLSFSGFRTLVSGLNVNAVIDLANTRLTIAEVVAQNLSAIAGPGAANIRGVANEVNLGAFVAIVRAAGGNDGLE